METPAFWGGVALVVILGFIAYRIRKARASKGEGGGGFSKPKLPKDHEGKYRQK